MWIDLEMTGLDTQRDVILQAALVITDGRLAVLDEFACDIWQPDIALAIIAPTVRAMHTANGLLDRVRASQTDVAEAERALLARVAAWCSYPATLCGNCVGTDRRFLDRWMPALGGYLSHRIVDVSSMKVLARLWYGEDAVYQKPDLGKHDARVDVRNSVAELRHYRDTLLRPP